MFFHLLYIHLFRPFLKYSQGPSALKLSVPPKRQCIQAAEKISKYLRIYKRTYGLRQICNIAVYIAHSACTIHLLNLPEKNARRDIIHGVRQLEEIAEGWLCARKTLGILGAQARKWKIELPEEVATVLARTDAKFGYGGSPDPQSPKSDTMVALEAQQNLSYVVPSQSQGLASRPYPDRSPSIPSAAQPKSVYREPVPPSGTSIGARTMSAPTATATTEFPIPYPQQRYVISQAQRNLWNQDLARRNRNPDTHPSPTDFFGGVPALIDDSQDSQRWWLSDDHQSLYENWGKTDNAAGLVGDETSNAMIDMSIMNEMNIDMNGMNGFGDGTNAGDQGYGSFALNSFGVPDSDTFR